MSSSTLVPPSPFHTARSHARCCRRRWGKLDLVALPRLTAARNVRVHLCEAASLCALGGRPGDRSMAPGGLGYATNAEAVAAAVHGLDQLPDELDSFVEGDLILGTHPFRLRAYASGSADNKEQETASCVGFSLSSQAAVPLAVTFRMRVFVDDTLADGHGLVSYHCVQRLELSETWWCGTWIPRSSMDPVPKSLRLQFDQISILTLEHVFQPVPTVPALSAEQLAVAEASREPTGVVAHVTGLRAMVAALNDSREALTSRSFVLAGSSWTLAIQKIDEFGLAAESGGTHISGGNLAVDLVHEGFESIAVSAEVTIAVGNRQLYHGMPAAQLHTRQDDRCLRTIFPARSLQLPGPSEDDEDMSRSDELRIEIANVDKSEFAAGADTPRAGGVGRPGTFVWSMLNFGHLTALAARMDGWYVSSEHFHTRGRDWSLRVCPQGDEIIPGSAGKLVTRVVLESSAWTWAAFVVELTDERGVTIGSVAADGASPRPTKKHLKMGQFTNTLRDTPCVFGEESGMVWQDCIRCLVSDMVVVGMEAKEDALIWSIDGYNSLPLGLNDDVSWTFHRVGCKWRMALFLTNESRDIADLGVRVTCMSEFQVTASFTLSIGLDLVGELARQRVADHDFGRAPSVAVTLKRKLAFGVQATGGGTVQLSLAAMCCSWASVSTSLQAGMSEIPQEQDSKLYLHHNNGSMLQSAKPSGSGLLNVTLCAERRPMKVRWIVTVKNSGGGVGVGVAVRGAVQLEGEDILQREVVGRIRNRDDSLVDLSGIAGDEVETDLERQVKQACSSHTSDFVLWWQSVGPAEGSSALARVLAAMRREGSMSLVPGAFENVKTMTSEALHSAVAGGEWKIAAGLLQAASHYRSEEGVLVQTALADLPVVQQEGFWDNVYLAQCEHERARAERHAHTPEEKRLVAENTYLSQALTILAMMQDMGADATKRHALVQCIVDSGMIAGPSANMWFVDFVGNLPIISPATDGGLMPDEDSRDSPGRRTFSGLASEPTANCAVIECSHQPEAGVPMDPALWSCPIPPAGTGGVAVVGTGDKLCLEWVHAPEHGCGFLKIQNHSRDNSWAYTREVRTDTTREQRWRPAVWLNGGAQVEIRGTSIWMRPPKSPARPKAPVCAVIPDAADAVCLAWEHDLLSGDTPVTEYVIQSRQRKMTGGGWTGDWETHSRHVPAHNGDSSHEVELRPLVPDGTRYTFRVVAHSLGGHSEPSDPCRLWQTPALPSLRKFSVVSVSSTECEISWVSNWRGCHDEQRRLRLRYREQDPDEGIIGTKIGLEAETYALASPVRANDSAVPELQSVFSSAQYFRCVHAVCNITRDFDVQVGSEPVGQLLPGDAVEVLQTRTNREGYVRLRTQLGWVDSADLTTGASLLIRMSKAEVAVWQQSLGATGDAVRPTSPPPVKQPLLLTTPTASPARTSLSMNAVGSPQTESQRMRFYSKIGVLTPPQVQRPPPVHGRASSLDDGIPAPALLLRQVSIEEGLGETDGGEVAVEDVEGTPAAAVGRLATTEPELRADATSCRVLKLKPGTDYLFLLEAALDSGRTVSTLEVTTTERDTSPPPVLVKVRSV